MNKYKTATAKSVKTLWDCGRTFKGSTNINIHDFPIGEVPKEWKPTQWANDCIVFSRKIEKYDQDKLGVQDYFGSFSIDLFVKLDRVETNKGTVSFPDFVKRAQFHRDELSMEKAVELCEKHNVDPKWIDFDFKPGDELPF